MLGRRMGTLPYKFLFTFTESGEAVLTSLRNRLRSKSLITGASLCECSYLQIKGHLAKL